MSKITTSGFGSAAARNLRFVLVPALLACTSLTGCGTIMDALTQSKADGTVSAQPIDLDHLKVYQPSLAGSTSGGSPASPPASPSPVSQPSGASDNASKVEYLGAVVRESEGSCLKFVSGLVLGENTINTTLDVSATLFSVLSTAVTPPGTKTALSAISSIASGSKTAIDQDIYDKAAISDFATAILGTYYADVKSYSNNLSQLTEQQRNDLIVNLEIAKIFSIHAECGLAPAESSIRGKLGVPKSEEQQQAPPNPPGAQLLSQQGTVGQQQPSATPTSGVVPGRASW